MNSDILKHTQTNTSIKTVKVFWRACLCGRSAAPCVLFALGVAHELRKGTSLEWISDWLRRPEPEK